MERIKILVDTSVLVDFFVDNEPFSDYAKKILFLCHKGEVDGIVAATSLVQLFYSLQDELSVSERREMLRLLLKIFSVPSIDKQKIFEALSDSDTCDLLQSLQMQTAATANVDYIITNSLDSYHNTDMRIMSSGQFVSLYESASAAQKLSESFGNNRNRGGAHDNTIDDWQARFRASAYGL